MDGPDQSEQILPPYTGEYDLIHLMQYPNGRVRALAGLLRTTFGWTTRDTFSGEYIAYLCNYVERAADGSYNFSRIQPTDHSDLYLATVRYNQGRGPAPHRITYVETRRAFARRVGQERMQVDGTYAVGMERIPVGGRICIATGRRDSRGRMHYTPSTCHTW
jgi:hypothetical protein